MQATPATRGRGRPRKTPVDAPKVPVTTVTKPVTPVTQPVTDYDNMPEDEFYERLVEETKSGYVEPEPEAKDNIASHDAEEFDEEDNILVDELLDEAISENTLKNKRGRPLKDMGDNYKVYFHKVKYQTADGGQKEYIVCKRQHPTPGKEERRACRQARDELILRIKAIKEDINHIKFINDAVDEYNRKKVENDPVKLKVYESGISDDISKTLMKLVDQVQSMKK